MADYLQLSLAKLEGFEGSIPWMYLDTVGKVTVGVGLMLPDAAAAGHLLFQVDGRTATEAEVSAEFARVDAMPMGRPALFYRHAGAPELTTTEIDSLLRTVLIGFEGELRSRFAGYDGFPDGVKMALLDMIYNLGPAGLFHGFPRLMRAVSAEDWAQAASASLRHGPGAARNEWTRAMFLQSVVGSIHAVGESGIKRLGYGLLGASATAAGWIRKKF